MSFMKFPLEYYIELQIYEGGIFVVRAKKMFSENFMTVLN